jgi:hypothetical protein
MGYLGKISAIVTANTGDFKPKLDAAASDVQKFARTVQSNLTSASSSASKAFEGIYTPLQKLERGLQAAASMKLSFKGFEGALRDVDALKGRLASLGKRQIDISVTGTGFAKVSELRDAISKITSKDVKFVSDLGGLQQARSLLAAMSKEEQEVINKFEKLQSLDQITVAIEIVGKQGLEAAELKMRQTAAAAKLIAEPLNEAARVAAGLGLAMQQNVSAAMAQVQAKAEAVKDSLGTVGASNQFGSVAREARGLLAVLKQLAEAQAAIGGMSTGRELSFANPRLAAQLQSARALTNRAAGQPASFIEGTPDVSRLTQRINRNAQRASEAYSGVVGATTDAGRAEAEAKLLRVQDVLDGLMARLSKQLPLDVDTSQATSKIKDFESHLIGLSSRRVTNLPPNFFRDRVAEQSRKRDEEIDAATVRFSRRATNLPPNYLPDRLRQNEEKRFKGMFGDSPDSSAARVGDLASKVRSLQSAMSDLPIPVQAKLIPALERAKQAVFALGNNPAAGQLARAAQEAVNLERNLKRAQTAAQFRGNFGSFLDSNAASNYAAQLNAIRQGMAAVGATASGPVATAIGKYQKALIDASNAGTLSTATTKKDLDELLNKIAQVATAGKLMTEKQAAGFVQNVQRSSMGDVGRMGADKFNLAMGQAAFAIDDFMSSTGGLEFKLRAISNNITQMAFILGGTTGLWIGLGAVIGTTLAIPLARAIFDFGKFEEQNKALNGELEKSKNIAEKTAEAYKELGKALRESGMGGGQSKAEDFAKDRRAEAVELAKSRVLGSSADFAEAQSRVLSLEGQVEKTTDIGTRGKLLRQLDEAKKQRDAIQSRSIAPPSMSQVNADLNAARAAEIALRGSSRSNWEATDAASARRAREASREKASDVKKPEDAVAALDKQISQLGDAIKSSNFFERARADYVPEMSSEAGGTTAIRRAREQIAKLEEERARIQEDIVLRRNERFMPRAMAAAAAAELTPGVRDRVAGLGLGGNVTSQFESQIAGVSKEFADIITQLEKVTREGGNTAELEKAADDAAKALEFLYQEADKFARDVALGALVPTKERLDRAAEQLSGIGPSNIATDIARAQARRQELEGERDRAKTRGDEFGANRAEYELDRVDRLTTKLEAAANAVAIFQRAIEEAAVALSRTLVQEAQNREQELRRAANRNPAFAGAAADAQAEARNQEGRDRALERALNRERIQFEAEIPGNAELSALAERARAGRAGAANRENSAEDQEKARIDAEEAELELRRRFEQRAGVRQARAAVDAADAASAQEKDRIALANEMRQRQMSGMAASLDSVVGDSAALGGGIQGLDLRTEMEQLQRDMEAAIAAGIESPFDDAMNDLRDRIEKVRVNLLDNKVWEALRKSFSTEGMLDAARKNLSGVGISNLQGQMTEMEVRRSDLEKRRDEAIRERTPEGDKRARAIQGEIDAQNNVAAEILATSVALGGFQEALNKAAMTLQNTLVGEATGRAGDARRRENEAAATFGANSPEARRARGQRERAEQAMQDAEDERQRAEKSINEQRVAFEEEMATGQNPAAKARADRIAELEKFAAGESGTSAQREDAAAEARRLRSEQQREFESRPEVQAERDKADKADREMQRRQSIERGLEMGRTEEDRRKEEIARQAGDLGNAAKFLRDEGRGNEIRGLARKAAMEMAKDVAPLYAQLGEEVMTARLQGPSRAALNVSDINTAQGASELNRLIRGDDSARDVNLTELKKQSSLLEAIERAVLQSTGVVVNL